MIDASGKWECLALTGPGATRLLASAIAIDAVLAGRGCAALSLFDCPAIITREAENFVLWVQSSYAADFMATAGRLQAVLEPQG
jgi:sarcosine oxidase gamma subunit